MEKRNPLTLILILIVVSICIIIIGYLFYTGNTKNKFIKFSAEKMILGVGVKWE